METHRRPNAGKAFNIELDSPPNYVYTDGEIVSGRVTLLSSSDEEVFSVILMLTGTAKSYVGMTGRNGSSIGMGDQWEGRVLFNARQQLYEGNYKLRKGVTYEWPFKMRFPASMTLIPSGDYGKHMMSIGETTIEYQLKAFRASSAEQAKALAKTTTQTSGAGIMAKVRSIGASTASSPLYFMPSRPNYVDPELTPTREHTKLPALPENDQQVQIERSKRFSLKSIFATPSSPTIDCTVRVDLPKNIIQYERFPVILRVIPKSGQIGPVTVEKVEFIVSARVRHKANGFVGENLENYTIFKLEKPGIVINDPGKHDISGRFSNEITMWPTFNSDLIETRHNLRAHVTLNASWKKFKDIFTLTGIHIFPNRVTCSPLNKNYICSFYSQTQRSSVPSDNGEDENTAKDVVDAFFTVSRLLTSKAIHPQVIAPRDPSAVMALLLPGQNYAKPSAPISEDPVIPHGTIALPDPVVEDQRKLSGMLNGSDGIRATKTQSSARGSFAYLWGGENSTTQARVDFSIYAEDNIASSSAPPPSYSAGLSSASSILPPSTHTDLTITSILNTLLHTASISDPITPSFAASNARTIADILHLCQEYSSQLVPQRFSISVPSAQQAVAKYPQLCNPLINLAGVDPAVLGEEEDDEPKPRILSKEEAKAEKQREMANKIGYWSTAAQKREQIYGSN